MIKSFVLAAETLSAGVTASTTQWAARDPVHSLKRILDVQGAVKS
jgi:hypothetical protein